MRPGPGEALCGALALQGDAPSSRGGAPPRLHPRVLLHPRQVGRRRGRRGKRRRCGRAVWPSADAVARCGPGRAPRPPTKEETEAAGSGSGSESEPGLGSESGSGSGGPPPPGGVAPGPGSRLIASPAPGGRAGPGRRGEREGSSGHSAPWRPGGASLGGRAVGPLVSGVGVPGTL